MSRADKVVIFLNGQARQIPDNSTLDSLVEELHLKPKMVLIELNGRALLRHEWPSIRPAHGDRLEILRVVAGG